MLKQLVNDIRQVYSGRVAKRHVAEIAQHHRIQASPGYRAAANYVLHTVQAAGIGAELLQFPAKEGIRFWSQPSFQEWECDGARLELLEEDGQAQVLCDYRVTKLSLIQRSAPTPSCELELVHVADGTEAEHYEGLDVRNKLVLTTGSVDRVYDLAVARRGAAGIVFYGMREVPGIRQAMDLPDALQYTSFWWYGEQKCYGFVLSPRQGERLRSLIQERQGQDPLRVRAWVDSRFTDGHLDVVSATIPGETPDTVLVVAHLCHPEPSANDNASGAGAAIEVACALQRLIDEGELAVPLRSIQFLWVPEMTGTYAYLSTHQDEIRHMVAGINLDMVGEDQAACGSVWIIESPSASTMSFVTDLLAAIRGHLGNDVKNLAGNGSYGLFRAAESAFSGGSDHYILSDPTVGVPTPMMIQWPDKYYHTSEDTLDKVSEQMLAKVGVTTAAYAYFCAAASGVDVQWLANEMFARQCALVARRVQDVLEQVVYETDIDRLATLADQLARRAGYWSDLQREAFFSLLRLDDQIEPMVKELSAEVDQLLQVGLNHVDNSITGRMRAQGETRIARSGRQAVDREQQRAASRVPRRVHPGPANLATALRQMDASARDRAYQWMKAHRAQSEMMILAQYWADGKRTIAEIAEQVELESGQADLPFLVEYFDWLSAARLARLGQATRD